MCTGAINGKKQIFDQFESEYMKWCETGERPSACDRDSAFLLEVQRKRLVWVYEGGHNEIPNAWKDWIKCERDWVWR